MAQGPDAGLDAIAVLERERVLSDYYLLHAAKADLLRRAERYRAAASCYDDALARVGNDRERAYLERRRRECLARLEDAT